MLRIPATLLCVSVLLTANGPAPHAQATSCPGGAAGATMIPATAPCYACHAKEAAHHDAFTQFYPPLRGRLAQAAKTGP